jgi:hypothetical protein
MTGPSPALAGFLGISSALYVLFRFISLNKATIRHVHSKALQNVRFPEIAAICAAAHWLDFSRMRIY